MKLSLAGLPAELEDGLALLAPELGVTFAADGFPIEVVREEGVLAAECEAGRGRIRYDRPVHFYRAFGLWLQHCRGGGDFRIAERPAFASNGVMTDASRNAVPTVAAAKRLLRAMSLMGLNLFMLYTEDTYTVEGYPYFGYMRGRYTMEELREIDDYAFALGIEAVPCIQTLAHLTEALKWNFAADLRDTPDILLAGSEPVYGFIRSMIAAASSAFRSRRIHIGMDEAHQLGLGRYLERNGYRERFGIMTGHLERVLGITREFGLQPMMWSDMYFRLGSEAGDYYDTAAVIPEEAVRAMPQDVQYVYWDYYHTDPAFYAEMIRKHRRFGANPVFAGGVWTWGSMAPNYGKTFETTAAAMAACKAEGVSETFAAMWGDNGAETSPFAGLAGLQLYAEHGYADRVDPVYLAERFAFCAGGDWADALALNRFDETPGVAANNPRESNPSKFLLWQDVLTGLYDENIRGLPMGDHYAALAQRMERAAARAADGSLWAALFGFYAQLAGVLSAKAELGLALKAAYDEGDREELARLRERVVALAPETEELRRRHRSLWLAQLKPFGWEVLDIRYGGLAARLETAAARLADYLAGTAPVLEELAAERLKFDAPWELKPGELGRGVYHRIVTAGTFSV